jgi:hypothetical protein
MCKQLSGLLAYVEQPVHCLSRVGCQSFVFSSGPACQPAVDAFQRSAQGGGVVPAVVVDSAAKGRVEPSGQVGQFLVAHSMDVPGGHLGRDGLGGFGADRREEVAEQPAPPVLGASGFEGVAEKVELNVLVVQSPVGVPAIHDGSLSFAFIDLI